MDKILLITGATSEVGMHLVKEVYENYKLIYLQYRTMNHSFQTMLDELRIKGNTEIIPLEADFSNEDSVVSMIESIKADGRVPNHVVHFPAPKAYNKQFNKDKWENYKAGWEISVHSIVSILKAFIPDMAKQKYGRIVFMLTSCTLNNPPKYQSSYVTVKYALLGLMKSLAIEYADRGITANGVSPDMMETKFLSEIPEYIVEKNKESSPIGRNIYVEEVVPVITYMLSDMAASMTGQNIGITGGL